jgi:hypothetical protein
MTERLEDFQKKYQGTFVRYMHPDRKVKIVAYIEYCHLEENTIAFTCEDIGSVMLKYPACLTMLDLEAPPSGLFNHNDHALFLFKTPARQWHRGLCAANHEIYNPFRKLFTDGTYRAAFGRASVRSIFEENYITDVQEAVNDILNHPPLKSVAITRNLMLSKSPTEALPLIWYRTIPVGFVRLNRFIVEDELYQQEVNDELNRIGQYRWIS